MERLSTASTPSIFKRIKFTCMKIRSSISPALTNRISYSLWAADALRMRMLPGGAGSPAPRPAPAVPPAPPHPSSCARGQASACLRSSAATDTLSAGGARTRSCSTATTSTQRRRSSPRTPPIRVNLPLMQVNKSGFINQILNPCHLYVIF